ncbi:hypothetical protein VTK73DRAFT_9782 [Phialemonium thermophilum]|uniref:Uncharacterized protein n=1 Tax=Phialemonium thermophilum TaxID=223376 RepID=A0ABR3W0P5_9PEZI
MSLPPDPSFLFSSLSQTRQHRVSTAKEHHQTATSKPREMSDSSRGRKTPGHGGRNLRQPKAGKAGRTSRYNKNVPRRYGSRPKLAMMRTAPARLHARR